MASYTSHFGVYALIPDAAKTSVLLIKKARGCYTGLYDLPGGTMEPHELLEETLKREVLEETGCTVTDHEQLETFSTLYQNTVEGNGLTLRHIGTVYRAGISGTPRADAGDLDDDSDGAVWVPVNDLSDKNAAPFVLMALKRIS